VPSHSNAVYQYYTSQRAQNEINTDGKTVLKQNKIPIITDEPKPLTVKTVPVTR
jgi:hypothetical protein